MFEIFIRRPILSGVISVVIVFLGLLAINSLPITQFPDIVPPSVTVTARYTGANADVMAKTVATPLERAINGVPGMTYMTSVCTNDGMSLTTIYFKVGTDPDVASVNVQNRVTTVLDELPEEVIRAGVITEKEVNSMLMYLNIMSSDSTHTEKFVYNFADINILRELKRIDGVGFVEIMGSRDYAMRVWLNPNRLAAYNMSPQEVTEAIRSQNIEAAPGKTGISSDKIPQQLQYVLQYSGKFSTPEEYGEIVLKALPDGSVLRLKDVATIEFDSEDYNMISMTDGKPSASIMIKQRPGSNAREVIQQIKAKMEELKETTFAPGMEYNISYDVSRFLDASISVVLKTLLEAFILVFIVVYLFLQDFRSTLIPAIAVPVSLIGTFFFMQMLGFSINMLTLFALVLAIGIVVDNAIVVTDNAQVGIKRGLSRYQALVDGATKPQWALLGATFIAVCSFLPMYLAPASVAEIVKPLFIVLAVSLGLSWILALTQTTTFGNFILKEAKPGESKDPYDTKLYHKFEKVLGRLIKRRYLTLTSVVATLFLSLFIMSIMPQSFFPIMNKPYFRADLIFPEGYGIDDVERNVIKIEEYLKNNDKIKSYSFTLGGSPVRYYLASSSIGPKPNFANVLIETKDAKDAQSEENKFYEYMVANYPDILTRSALFALSPVPDAAIEIGFVGDNIDTLVALTQRAQEIARKNDMVMEVRSSWGNKVPVWKPLYSQEKGLRLGITRQQMAYSLRSATNGVPLGEYREGDVFMPILLKDADRDSMNLNDIKTLPVYSAKGRSVKVEQVIDDFSLDYEYSVVKRYNRQRYMMMQCEPKRGANTMAAFSQLWQDIQQEVQVPEGYKLQYFGEQSEQDKGNKAIAANIPLMFGLIYLTLLFLFPKYYRKPVLIMCMLPLIFIGVVLGLLVFGKSLDFFAMLGLLGLIGMNIKNAIVLVDEIGLQLNAGLSPVNAVIEATKTRIVPVTMASGTTILGMLPLLGDAMFAGMAATIMGGLFVSTILTIFVLPVTYCVFFKIKSE